MSGAEGATVGEALLAARVDLIAVYEKVRETLTSAHLRGGDLIMLHHPIKAPFLEMYDSLGAMAAEIDEGKWLDG